MEEEIRNISLSFSCEENWDSMTPSSQGRACDKCNKTVYDLTDKKVAYFRKILEENDYNLCVRLSPAQMAPSHPAVKSYWRAWTAAALLFLGINVFTENSKAQGKISAQQLPKAKSADSTYRTIGVLIANFHTSYPGGMERFNKYISQKLVIPDQTPRGKVSVGFTIERNGDIVEVILIKGLSDVANREALNLIKNSPRWMPAIVNGRPVREKYTVSISFDPNEPQNAIPVLIKKD